tara:strand:+ start:177 stop:506 length:330 start_codon:yes stop_codon:yes gene_type:complete
MYALDKGLEDLINAQRAEAREFSMTPGCYMGSMPEATDLRYWAERVPTGTLAEYKRIELEESVYYAVADAYSKGYARNLRLSVWTNEELEAELEAACAMIQMQSEAQCA